MAIAVSQLCNTNIQDVLKLDSISDVDPQLLTKIKENAVEASIAHSRLSIEFWKSISLDKRKSIGSKIS